jgi:hypothetical protein
VPDLNYTAVAVRVPIGPSPLNLWEIQASAGSSLVIARISIEFIPLTYANGVDLVGFVPVAIQTLASLGSGGALVTPVSQDARNMTAALTSFYSNVTTPGTIGNVISASSERIDCRAGPYSYSRRIPMSAGGMLAIAIGANFYGTSRSAPFSATTEISFEEF